MNHCDMWCKCRKAERSGCTGFELCGYSPLSDCVSGACANHCRRDCKCGAADGEKLVTVRGKLKSRFDWPDDLNI